MSTRDWGTEAQGTHGPDPSCQRGCCQKTSVQEVSRTSCPPSPHTQAQEGLRSGGPRGQPPALPSSTVQLAAPLALLQVFMTFSHLKYGLLPRTGRRRRVPANSLIYKSIWQGTINSCPTVGMAGGGAPSTQGALSCQGGQEGPCTHTHPALPNATGFVRRTQIGLSPSPSGAPPGRVPLPVTSPAPPPGAGTQPPKEALWGKKTINPQYWAAQDTGPCPSRAARQR